MKKSLVLLISVLLVVAVFFIFGSDHTISLIRVTPENNIVTINWWGGVPEQNGPAEVVKNFNQQHPYIKLSYVFCPNDDAGNTKLDMNIVANSEVDVFSSFNNSALMKRIKSGVAMPLDSLLEQHNIKTADIYGESFEQQRIDGVYYYLPSTTNTNFIFYNQTMFDEANISRPTYGWSYAEFEEAAKAIHNDNTYGYYYPSFDAGQQVTEFVSAKLGLDWLFTTDRKTPWIDIPELRTSFSWYLDRVRQGIEPDFVSNKTQKMTPEDMFLNQKSAMVFGPWIIRNIKDTQLYPHDFVTGFATIPKFSTDQSTLYTSALTEFLSINNNSTKADAALTFINWYITEGFDPMIKHGKLPAYLHYDKNKIIELMFDGCEKLFDLEEAKQVFLTPSNLTSNARTALIPEINDMLTNEFQKAYTDEQTIEQSLQIIQGYLQQMEQ